MVTSRVVSDSQLLPVSDPDGDLSELLAGCDLAPSEEVVRKVLARGPVTLWGVGGVAPLHLGYDELIVRQKQLVELGCRHVVLLADYHTMMSHGLSFQEASRRAAYYEHFLQDCCGLDAHYIRGSTFQTRTDYIEPLMTLVQSVPFNKARDHLPASARRALADGTCSAGVFNYLLMQCLDVLYLGADLIFAERGQKKIYDLLDTPRRPHIGPRLFGGTERRMSARSVSAIYSDVGHDIAGKPLAESSAGSRISIHETRDSLAFKVRKMFAPPAGQPIPDGRTNALLHTFKYSVFPWRDEAVTITGARSLSFDSYEEFAAAYDTGQLHPNDCKTALVECLWQRFCAVHESWNRAVLSWVDTDKVIGLKDALPASLDAKRARL